MGRRLYFALGLPLETAEVRTEDDFGAMAQRELNGWKGLAYARVVENLSAVVRERDVEVHADQHMLVLQQVGPFGEAAECRDLHDE